MIAAKFITLETSATGTDFVPFANLPAHCVNVINDTGIDLTFQHVNDADNGEFILPNGMAFAFRGINNANQLQVKRTDESATQVTLTSVEVEL